MIMSDKNSCNPIDFPSDRNYTEDVGRAGQAADDQEDKMTSTFTTEVHGQEVTIEVFFDEQPGVEPGWCWRGKGQDAGVVGGDILDATNEEDAVDEAKRFFGL
jgi:hypothetical protein